MTFLYTDTRTHRERKIADAAIRNSWTVSDIFVPEADFVSSYQSEPERLKWAPILVALAFGENTAHDGFGSRIAAANDIATKNWLCIHLLDESKHTEGFSSLLNYLYPSLKGNHQILFSHRDAFRFYGHTHRAESPVFCLGHYLLHQSKHVIQGADMIKIRIATLNDLVTLVRCRQGCTTLPKMHNAVTCP